MSQAGHPTSQLSVLTKKRLALESLIRITVSIQTQQQSLQELSVIARPSQDIPVKLISHIKLLSEKLGNLSVSEIIQRLEAIERVMTKGLNRLLSFVQVDPNQLRDELLEDPTIDNFVDAIGNFKRRTQTAVALRFLLNDRGVAIAPFSMDIPQESIFEHIETLKIKEKHCVKQIRKEIVDIMKISEKMIQDKSFSDAMKSDIIKVQQAMQVNLEHLDSGGKINELPNVFETIVLESPVSESLLIEEPVGDLKIPSEQAVNKEPAKNIQQPIRKKNNLETQREPKSFWGSIKIWLSSPWKVSWRSIRKNSKK